MYSPVGIIDTSVFKTVLFCVLLYQYMTSARKADSRAAPRDWTAVA